MAYGLHLDKVMDSKIVKTYLPPLHTLRHTFHIPVHIFNIAHHIRALQADCGMAISLNSLQHLSYRWFVDFQGHVMGCNTQDSIRALRLAANMQRQL